MTKLELQLISTDDLTEELKSRFDGFVVHGIQKDPKNNSKSIYYDNWFGDHATLLGLCELLKDKILRDSNDSTEDLTD